MRRLFFLALTALFSCAGPAPSNLRVEHQEGPIVLDPGTAPRLSWINGTNQSARQILVSLSADSFDESRLVWDSGKVVSPESHLVPYEGPSLEPMTDYYWKVRIWDGHDKASAWSKPSRITTGPASGAWEAEWIGAPWQADERGAWYTRYPLFRKEFRVGDGLTSANLFISGLGYFEARINGEKVGEDFFVPGFTDYTLRPYLAESKRIPLDPAVTAYRTLYLAYDVSQMLKEGDNAIGVTLGNGYFHTRPMAFEDPCESYGVPRLVARLELCYKDGRRESICTDTSWKSAESAYVFGDLWDGEVFDAREVRTGWDQAGFDDSAWPSAVVRTAPDGPLTANMGPADRVTENLVPVSFERLDDGSFKVDFGKVISGWIDFHGIRGAAGDTLTVNYLGEYASPRCQYIFADDKPVEWHPGFTWFVFREAVISGVSELSANQLTAQAVNSQVRVNSEFRCSNPLFENILELFRRAQLDNMHSGVASDCPHRERLPYTGDGEVAQAAVLSFFDAASFYNKWIGEITGSQNPGSGHVPNTAPWEPMGGGGPAWGAAICVMPWEFYLRYGDRRILEQSLEGMRRYVNYLGTWEREDGTILVQKTTPDGKASLWYNLGDWVPPFGNPDESLVHSFFYWLCARNTALSAKALGNKELAAEASGIQKRIWEAFHKRFYDASQKSYGENGSNVYALYMGVPGDRLDDVRNTLREELEVTHKGHLNTGFIATRYLFETLSLNGMGDLAYTIMNQRDYPSYGWWIEQGATTLWESWNGDASRNHPMFGGALTWYSRILAGVDTDPQAPGFKHVIIRPVPSPQLSDVFYSTETPYGKISSHVRHDGNRITLEVTVPAGSTATVYVPKSMALMASDPLSDDSFTVYEAGPGHHVYENENTMEGRGYNPISPMGVYMADPSAKVIDGKLYVACSLDLSEDRWCSPYHHLLSTGDLRSWTLHTNVLASAGPHDAVPYSDAELYAPDIVEKDGRYYMYYDLSEGTEGVAVSDSPAGPFTGGVQIEGIRGIDPCVFIDDDGQAYYFWDQFSARGAKLNPDMKSLDMSTLHEGIVTEEEHGFHEGSFVFKRNGWYYYVYADVSRKNMPTCIGYAMSRNVWGPYEYKGVIVDNDGCDPDVWNNHGSVAEFNGQWYVLYHRSTHHGSKLRKACIEPITFNADGTINEVEMTSQGAGGPIPATETIDAARACLVSGGPHVRLMDGRSDREILSGAVSGGKAAWKYIDFPSGVHKLILRVRALNGGHIGVAQDQSFSRHIAGVNIPKGKGEWITVECEVSEAEEGPHALWFMFSGEDGSWKNPVGLFEIDWFRFE